MKLLLLLSLFGVLALTSGQYTAPSARKIRYYKSVLNWVLKRKIHLVPKAVKLGFYDCVGVRCDGCINLHNPVNKGLTEIIEVAEECYKNLNVGRVMSRADFWQLLAITATEFGIKKNNEDGNKVMPSTLMTVRWGRKDCPNSPRTSDVHCFPKPTMNRTVMFEFFKKNYGFKPEEVVVIMGGHTLGGAKVENSGYRGNWTKDPYQFNTEYYKNLLTNGLKVNVAIDKDDSNADGDKKWQWDIDTGVMMLNTDVHLAFDINVHPLFGTTNCNFDLSGSKYCRSVPTTELVKDFGNYETIFWDLYRAAYDKLSQFGYNSLEVVDLE